MNRIRIGVAGLGRIGWAFHAKGLAAHPDFELAAVADMMPERRAQAETELGCKSYERFEDIIAAPGLDAIVIATPTHFHRDMALKAFARGLHVLLEKPMAMDKAQALDIAKGAAEARRVLTVYQPHRLGAYFQTLRKIVNAGSIGRIYWARRAMFGYARRNDWQSLLKFGGGMLNNYGAHGVDQILGLIGFDVTRLFCDRQRVASLGDAEDVVKIVMETRAGVIGEVEISQASAINPYTLLVWGTHGGVLFSGGMTSGQFTVRRFDPDALPPKAVDERLASEGRQYPSDNIPFIEETVPVNPAMGIDVFADFAAGIRTGQAPAVKPEESLAVMDVLDRCRNESGPIQSFA